MLLKQEEHWKIEPYNPAEELEDEEIEETVCINPFNTK